MAGSTTTVHCKFSDCNITIGSYPEIYVRDHKIEVPSEEAESLCREQAHMFSMEPWPEELREETEAPHIEDIDSAVAKAQRDTRKLVRGSVAGNAPTPPPIRANDADVAGDPPVTHK